MKIGDVVKTLTDEDYANLSKLINDKKGGVVTEYMVSRPKDLSFDHYYLINGDIVLPPNQEIIIVDCLGNIDIRNHNNLDTTALLVNEDLDCVEVKSIERIDKKLKVTRLSLIDTVCYFRQGILFTPMFNEMERGLVNVAEVIDIDETEVDIFDGTNINLAEVDGGA